MRPYRQNSRKKPSNDSKTTNHHTNRSLKRSNQKTTRKTQSKESVPREARNKITATPAQNRHCSRPLSSYQTANPPQKTRNTKNALPASNGGNPRRTKRLGNPKTCSYHAQAKPSASASPKQTKRKQNEAEKPAQTAPKKLRRKEVIQPHLPVRLPCYDLVPIASLTLDGSPPKKVRPPASGATHFHDLTGGVYKARERIHRGVLIRDY